MDRRARDLLLPCLAVRTGSLSSVANDTLRRLDSCRLSRTTKKRLTALIHTAENCGIQAFVEASVCKNGDRRFTLE